MQADFTSSVRHYYDRNTWKFLISGSQRAIHRELWGPGIASVGQAVHHVHDLVLARMRPSDRRILDLGSGVATAGLYLAARREVEVTGVTISPAQARLADRFTAATPAVRTVLADFTDLPIDLTDFDLAFAIESFVHAASATAFFAQVAGALGRSGTLLLVDDFRCGAVDDARLDDVRRGWHAATLVSVAEAAALAAEHGLTLVEDVDLSSRQRLGRPRDRLIRAAQPVLRRLGRRSVWAESLVGGDALQRCHQAGLLEYHLLRFQK